MKTEMVSSPTKTDMRSTEMVRVRILRPLEYTQTKDVNGQQVQTVHKFTEGKEYEIEKPLAKEICSLKFDGPYNFIGERDTRDATRHVLKYAERIIDKSDEF
jgi:hypothetical protein